MKTYALTIAFILITGLPTVLLVRASEEFEGARMMFEEDKNPALGRDDRDEE